MSHAAPPLKCGVANISCIRDIVCHRDRLGDICSPFERKSQAGPGLIAATINHRFFSTPPINQPPIPVTSARDRHLLTPEQSFGRKPLLPPTSPYHHDLENSCTLAQHDRNGSINPTSHPPIVTCTCNPCAKIAVYGNLSRATFAMMTAITL